MSTSDAAKNINEISAELRPPVFSIGSEHATACRDLDRAAHLVERAAFDLAGEIDRGSVTRLMLLSQELARLSKGLLHSAEN